MPEAMNPNDGQTFTSDRERAIARLEAMRDGADPELVSIIDAVKDDPDALRAFMDRVASV